MFFRKNLFDEIVKYLMIVELTVSAFCPKQRGWRVADGKVPRKQTWAVIRSHQQFYALSLLKSHEEKEFFKKRVLLLYSALSVTLYFCWNWHRLSDPLFKNLKWIELYLRDRFLFSNGFHLYNTVTHPFLSPKHSHNKFFISALNIIIIEVEKI